MEAASAYHKAAEISPDSNAALFVAFCLRDAGKIEEAIASFKEYIRSRPKDVDGWTGLGVMLKDKLRYEESVPFLANALRLKSNPEIRNTLISSLWRIGQNDKAQKLGLINLQEKDARALRVFVESPYKDYKLREGGKGFDPEHPSRNIISFSLWGDRPEYVTGAIVNAQIAKHMYVNWTARFYCDESVPSDALRLLRGYGAEIVMMNRPEHQHIRPMWRFLASDDPGVNVFVCRDADSRLNAKELIAVHDWLLSEKRFHIMRDHIYHHELILAGMWGGMAGVLPNITEWLAQGSTYFNNKFGDQAFLADMVWPLIRNDMKVHDTYYAFPNAKNFPRGYDLPGLIHVGGSVKSMPDWRKFPYTNEANLNRNEHADPVI
ncbi:hypothetical protein [Cypionkella sp.]|uniref:hypothetical protein n=1 Tax=Cypionkella sp. TaxID=2811411 RepID=UPI002ABC66AB|nr:hypothetical protein [Cypionkella sp.]MDZ4393934.1 hypothetical protein [Cypionkella sp.]